MGMYDKLANVQNVAPGAIAIISMPCNVTYDKLKLKLLGGLVAADITLIEGKANGKTFFTDTGANAVLRQAYKGLHTEAGYVTLDFTEPNARGGAVPQFMASIPANLLANLTFEVTIAGTANALSKMEAHVEFRAPTTNPFIRKMIKLNTNLPNVGDNDLFLPSGSMGGIIKRIWLHQAAILTGYELRVNNLSARRAVKADWNNEQLENRLVPQAGFDVIDFICDGNMQGALNTGADAKGQVPVVSLRATTSAAGAVTAYLEYIDPIGRL